MHKLYFYVPTSHCEVVKAAVFAAGAGKLGDYECCAWQTSGTGQFKPLANSRPFIGEQGQIESVTELKVEMVCADEHIKSAIVALKKAHPYEEPAFGAWKLADYDA